MKWLQWQWIKISVLNSNHDDAIIWMGSITKLCLLNHFFKKLYSHDENTRSEIIKREMKQTKRKKIPSIFQSYQIDSSWSSADESSPVKYNHILPISFRFVWLCVFTFLFYDFSMAFHELDIIYLFLYQTLLWIAIHIDR